MANIFSNLDRPRVARSSLDLSHEYKSTFDMGQLVPISIMEVLPGDVFRLGAAAVLRFQPMFAPILHRVKMRFYAFFTPYRILWEDWEEFITGGESGGSMPSIPLNDPNSYGGSVTSDNVIMRGNLWDYMGYAPVRWPSLAHYTTIVKNGVPHDLPRRAYVQIWNEYFRVPGIQAERGVPINVASPVYKLLFKNWTRDYFTSALPFQQRGTSPALPIFGNASAEFDTNVGLSGGGDVNLLIHQGVSGVPDFKIASGSVLNAKANLDAALDENTVDISSLSSVDINDLRLAWQTQVWLERNARGGARYTEQLQFRWGTRPLDARLQRPEFIGGYSTDFLFSEVLQTSSTDAEPSPQGSMAGHGIAVNGGNLGSYRAEEHGCIIILACADPVPAYMDGVNRQWLRRTKFDFPSPEFVHLGEQEIFNAELGVLTDESSGGQYNREPFGYTGIYNEMRYQPNIITGEMRDVFDYWHLARILDPNDLRNPGGGSGSAVPLNGEFLSIEHDLEKLKRIYAVQNVPGIIGSFGIKAHAVRPIPYMAIPSSIGGI